MASGSSSSSSSDSDGGTSDDASGEITLGSAAAATEELDAETWGIGAAAGRPDADTSLVMVEGTTARLAVVDLDWGRMRAADIFAVLQSFVPAKGVLRNVTVYVSAYGATEMAYEEAHGPRGVPAVRPPVLLPPRVSLTQPLFPCTDTWPTLRSPVAQAVPTEVWRTGRRGRGQCCRS